MMARRAFLFAAIGLIAPLTTHAVTLTFQGENKWVAQEDAAPLRKLQAEVHSGKTRLTARLPNGTDRALNTERLKILYTILQREAPNSGILLTETTTGPTPAQNTILVETSK